MIEAARAKLNLALHVTGRRGDGYHLLDSLVVFANLGDEVRVALGPEALSVEGPFAGDVPTGGDNLCLRAARAMGASVNVHLVKNLPVASGIGGGSADAAAVMRALMAQGVPEPVNPAVLGADIPVCLAGRPARMRGVGEWLEPVPPVPPLPLVLVNPGVPLSTPAVFSALSRRDHAPMPDPDWHDVSSLIGWLGHTRNDLQPAAITLAPVIAEVLAALGANGAKLARMSGSGATCFGIFDDMPAAARAARALARPGWWSVATELASDEPQGYTSASIG